MGKKLITAKEWRKLRGCDATMRSLEVGVSVLNDKADELIGSDEVRYGDVTPLIETASGLLHLSQDLQKITVKVINHC